MQAYDDQSLHPLPRPITRRGWAILAVVVLSATAILSGIVDSYDAEGRSEVNGGLPASDGRGLVVTMEPRSVDTHTGQAIVHLTLDYVGTDVVGDDGRMKANTRIVVLSSLGAQEVKYLIGDTIGQFDAAVGMDGDQADYPFDEHHAGVLIAADTYSLAADGSVAAVTAIPVGVRGVGSVNGWNTTMNLDTVVSDASISTFSFDRAFSTRMFAVLLLSLSIAIALMSIIVGVLVSTNRRRMEATLLSWGAALLFALPLLRNYLPNAPPIGASIDIYVYLWVIVAAVASLLMLVVAWAMQQRADLLAKAAARGSTT